MFLSCIVLSFLFLSLTLAHPRGNVRNHRHAPRQYTVTNTALNWGYFHEHTAPPPEPIATSTPSTTSSMDGYSTSSRSDAYSAPSTSDAYSTPSTSVTSDSAPSATVLPSSTVTSQTTSTTSETSSSSSPIASSYPSITTNDFLRGVNIGGWLILEEWMSSDVFSGDFQSAVDQWTFDSINGASDALRKHWDSWFTEADVQTIKSWGINALRIPIGFWAYDNGGTPYQKGADAYLDNAIGWAKAAGMKVMIDCHGSPGSQNGQDHSGHKGDIEWQQGDNLQKSIAVLTAMATKYGADEYKNVVMGIEIVNEPATAGNNNIDTTVQFAKDAYAAIRNASSNPDLMVITHDAWEGPTYSGWTNAAQSLGNKGSFGIDQHLYQLYTDSDNALDQAGHIKKACSWANDLSTANAIMPAFVGEWSAATNICVNPDGSTTAGTSCTVYGCQCQSADMSQWNDQMIEQVRRYVEAQLDVYEKSASGYFLWSWNGPGGWGIKGNIERGTMPNPVTDRKYPGQCGGY